MTDAGSPLEVVGRYDADGGIELEGTASGLSDLISLLRNGGRACRELEEAGVTAHPYDGLIGQLSIETIAGRVLVKRDGRTLRIGGGADKMALLANNIEFLVGESRVGEGGSRSSHHMHFEYHPGHFFLDERSEPLVVCVR